MDLCGVFEGELDLFVVVVMDEVGIDLIVYKLKLFDWFEDILFDVIVLLIFEVYY